MQVIGTIWLEHILEKVRGKHGVDPAEVDQLFESQPQIRFLERGHRANEDMYVAFGRTLAGRRLSVFFVYKPDQYALIISARDMSTAERRAYERRSL